MNTTNNKKHCYYYSIITEDNTIVYRCIYDDSNDIIVQNELNINKCRNFRLNQFFEATDEELYRFRKELKEYNDEIKKILFANKDKTCFRIDAFNYLTINEMVYDTVVINSDQKTINAMDEIDSQEFRIIENCTTSGLMSMNEKYLNIKTKCFGYDHKKYYYEMMRKIRIPITKGKKQVIKELDFTNLNFGIYRVKIICFNKEFNNCFNFNKDNHYTHNTLKTLYQYKDKFNIKFELLLPDEIYDYNFYYYSETIDLKKLFSGWFKIIDKLLKTCSSSNWLVKLLCSTAWGNLCKYKKHYVSKNDICNYDCYDLDEINLDKKTYEYYVRNCSSDIFVLVKSDNPYMYNLTRMKVFLTEFARNYTTNLILSNNLQDQVVRIHTDGIVFNQKVNFESMNLKYYPFSENKTTGKLTFYNINYYEHYCKNCKKSMKYEIYKNHECSK